MKNLFTTHKIGQPLSLEQIKANRREFWKILLLSGVFAFIAIAFISFTSSNDERTFNLGVFIFTPCMMFAFVFGVVQGNETNVAGLSFIRCETLKQWAEDSTEVHDHIAAINRMERPILECDHLFLAQWVAKQGERDTQTRQQTACKALHAIGSETP